jgi:hypothetical protein
MPKWFLRTSIWAMVLANYAGAPSSVSAQSLQPESFSAAARGDATSSVMGESGKAFSFQSTDFPVNAQLYALTVPHGYGQASASVTGSSYNFPRDGYYAHTKSRAQASDLPIGVIGANAGDSITRHDVTFRAHGDTCVRISGDWGASWSENGQLSGRVSATARIEISSPFRYAKVFQTGAIGGIGYISGQWPNAGAAFFGVRLIAGEKLQISVETEAAAGPLNRFASVNAHFGLRVETDSIDAITAATAPETWYPCHGVPIMISARVEGATPKAYAWRRNGIAITLTENPTAGSETLVISSSASSVNAEYDCVVTNSIGSGLTSPITIRVCTADWDCSGFLDFEDFDRYISGFEAGASIADVNEDGFLDFEDFDLFVLAFEAGC